MYKMTFQEALDLAPNQLYTFDKPKAIGWYMTLFDFGVYRMRWWNGKNWSQFCLQEDADKGRLDSIARSRSFLSGIAHCKPYWANLTGVYNESLTSTSKD